MKTLGSLACLAATAGLITSCTSGWTGVQSETTPRPEAQPSAFRVIRSSGVQLSFEDLVGESAMADLVFFGEQHDDPETHFAEFALLEGIGRHRNRVVLSLEM